MKRAVLVILVCFAVACPLVAGQSPGQAAVALAAEETKPRDYNPQKDPDVERGYKENQEYNRQRKSREEEQKKNNKEFKVEPGNQPNTYKSQ